MVASKVVPNISNCNLKVNAKKRTRDSIIENDEKGFDAPS